MIDVREKTVSEQLREIRESQDANDRRMSEDWNKHHALVEKETADAQAYRQLCRDNMTTIRDDFAKAAMAGLLAGDGWHRNQSDSEDVARTAYQIADAMLAERAG